MKGKAIVDAFEYSSAVLSYNFWDKSLPIWPFVRFAFLDKYSAFVNNLSTASSLTNKFNYADLLKSLALSVKRNPYFIPAKDVLFFNSSITNIKLEHGKYFNRVTDYYYYELPGRSALVEDLLQFKTTTPRVHSDVYSILPLKLGSQIVSMYPGLKLSSEDHIAIDRLIECLKSIAPVQAPNKFWQDCQIQFINHLKNVKASFKVYKQFLALKRPKLLFLEDAAYGSKLPLLLAAKSLGIPVAELQHGLINENHLAYQFGEALVEKLVPYMPNYFLSYANYWSNSVNLPSKKIEIGNPYLEEYLLKFPKKTTRKVLIVGTGMSKDQLIRFCKLLHSNPIFSDFQFILRPHPWEEKTAPQKYAELLSLGYKIDNQNLYESLSTSAVVFGEMSTAIFEASIYQVPIFLIATDHCKTNFSESIPFPIINIDPEVSKSNFLTELRTPQQNIWASNWRSNFQSFIRSQIN